MKYPYYIRIAILLCVGAFAPIMIHHIVYKLWDVSILRAAEKLLYYVFQSPIGWLVRLMNDGMMIENETYNDNITLPHLWWRYKIRYI